MSENRLGGKVRNLRRKRGLTQAKLAEQLGISTSYLNLIENNRRPLSAPLLIKLAQEFQIDLQSFASDAADGVHSHLMEVFSDPMFDSFELAGSDVRELSAHHPAIAKAVLSLYDRYKETHDSFYSLAGHFEGMPRNTLGENRLPTEEVNDLMQRCSNHFPDLEYAAEELRKDAGLKGEDIFPGLAAYLNKRFGIEVRILRHSVMDGVLRRFDRENSVLYLSEVLRRGSRNFQIAHQVGLATQEAVFEKITRDETLTCDESRSLARVALANYFAGAVLMPYEPFLDAARTERYDLELLGHRFRTSFEQVCHRLTTMRRPGNEGIPLHLIRIDVAGNISKRHSASGLRFARFSASCPRWNVHKAFLTPGVIRTQVSEMPDGQVFFCWARTLYKESGGYKSQHHFQAIGMGCDVRYAKDVIYSDGVNLEDHEARVRSGVTCRVCERTDCEQRAFPALQFPLKINENVKGSSFFSPSTPTD
ncbi:MAG: short-chain fatty acyl-CoA regulator family protein [Myxococcota bacterium]|nr:short-chain fatty acyl-CoA regulator family protein [Myxococcota bacterium]